jgi:hypothetical protein
MFHFTSQTDIECRYPFMVRYKVYYLRLGGSFLASVPFHSTSSENKKGRANREINGHIIMGM